MKNRRDQDEPGWPPWATILVVAILLGAFIWQAVPRHVIYIAIGVAVVIIGGVSYLVIRRKGFQAFIGLLSKTFERLKASNKQEKAQRQVDRCELTQNEKDRLKEAVGLECENSDCHKAYGLEVHHIIPRTEEGCTNRLRNLIVLCPDCHSRADHKYISRSLLRRWIGPPGRSGRFRRHPEILSEWKYGR